MEVRARGGRWVGGGGGGGGLTRLSATGRRRKISFHSSGNRSRHLLTLKSATLSPAPSDLGVL